VEQLVLIDVTVTEIVLGKSPKTIGGITASPATLLHAWIAPSVRLASNDSAREGAVLVLIGIELAKLVASNLLARQMFIYCEGHKRIAQIRRNLGDQEVRAIAGQLVEDLI